VFDAGKFQVVADTKGERQTPGRPLFILKIAGVVASYLSPTINTEDALTLEAAGLAPTEFVPHTTLRSAGEFSDQVAGPPAMGAVPGGGGGAAPATFPEVP